MTLSSSPLQYVGSLIVSTVSYRSSLKPMRIITFFIVCSSRINISRSVLRKWVMAELSLSTSICLTKLLEISIEITSASWCGWNSPVNSSSTNFMASISGFFWSARLSLCVILHIFFAYKHVTPLTFNPVHRSFRARRRWLVFLLLLLTFLILGLFTQIGKVLGHRSSL